MGHLWWREFRLAAQFHATGNRRRPARLCAFLDKRPFKLCQYAHHLPHGPACRGSRVNGFRQRPEAHVPRLQIIQQGYQVTQRPAQAVKFPDHQHITGVERLEAFCKLWPLDVRPTGLVGAYPLAPCLLQGSQLQVRVLVIDGDATIPDFHASIVSMIFVGCNSLFLQK